MSEPTLYDPDWRTAEETPGLLDPQGQMTFGAEDHGHAGILTVHGILDLMHYVSEEIAEWEQRGAVEDDVPEFLREALHANRPHRVDVLADVNPAAYFRTETYAIPVGGTGQTGGVTLVSARVDRLRCVLVNAGANPAFFSWTDDADNINTAGENAWSSLPVSPAPASVREIRAGGKIYVYSPLGTSVDITEEFGFKYREGGSLSA